MGRPVSIGSRLVGEGQPCFVIAEIGINHNGDLALAKQLMNASKEAGADAVKFQKTHAREMRPFGSARDYAGYPMGTDDLHGLQVSCGVWGVRVYRD